MENNIISERAERLEKLSKLSEISNPYPSKVEKSHSVGEVLADFSNLEKNKTMLSLAGRVMSVRTHGNLSFANLKDFSGEIQLAFSKNELGVDNYKSFVKLVDMADFLEVKGTCFVTHKGENSLLINSYRVISKALAPLPEKWHGLKDEEERLRKRYLDLLTNEELRDLFVKKAKFWQVIRDFMIKKGFFEVETPFLETTTGGAEARPFKTHHNDFDIDVYLRISIGELWQKRLMSAGYEKVFEIGKAFRNEGSSPDHLQEFTNMEFYWAYANYSDGMKLTQELYREIAVQVFGTTKFESRGYTYDLADEWPEIDYREEVLARTGIDILTATEDKMAKKLEELKVKYDGKTRERLMDTLWKYCRKSISGPAFLVNHPKLVSPLAKAKEESPELTERFQIIIAGSEIGNGYSELNDPVDQRKRFEEQQALIDRGDEEAMMPDWEFVEMLEHGMPPTCGFGMGERLFSFMANKSVRETTLFPLMKPKKD
jgi:lysyl-tRNA synthetase, class II